MSCSYLIHYRGQPTDSAAFLEHYRRVHGPIMRRYPNIRGCLLHHAIPWVDPVSVRPDGLFVMAELKFDSIEELNQALAAEVRQESRRDFQNFPSFEGQIRHQAISTEILF